MQYLYAMARLAVKNQYEPEAAREKTEAARWGGLDPAT